MTANETEQRACCRQKIQGSSTTRIRLFLAWLLYDVIVRHTESIKRGYVRKDADIQVLQKRVRVITAAPQYQTENFRPDTQNSL